MNTLLKIGHQVGTFLAILFLLCFVWFWIRPVHQELHLELLELSFFGFQGMNTTSFIVGLVQSYIWGYVGVYIWRLAQLAKLK